MKLLFKILFFLLAIFQTNISEAKTVLYSEVITSEIFNQQNEKIEVLNVISENDFGITCKNESSLVDYRNLAKCYEATAAKGRRNITHHIASNKHLSKYTPQFESIANKYGLKLDAAWNKVDISDVFHYSKTL